MKPILFMFHHNPLPNHVKTALAVLDRAQAVAGDAAPHFVFAGNAMPTDYKGQI
jgi:hypothetical protein